MCCVDGLTGEAVFELDAPQSVREVLLECFNQAEEFCLPMRRQHSRWSARVALTSGWFFYRFKVDGRPHWDRGTGTARTADGRRFSLTVIHRRQAKPFPHPLSGGRPGASDRQEIANLR